VNNQPLGMVWLNNLAANGPWPIVKIFMVIGLVMYTLFAVAMLKQVGVMTETFESEVNSGVKTLAWIHLLISIFLVLVAVVML
jgi:hypothetical protein